MSTCDLSDCDGELFHHYEGGGGGTGVCYYHYVRDVTEMGVIRPIILRWFATEHLPKHLADIVADYRTLACRMVEITNPGAEQSTALRKLLESKDAAVRACIELTGA